MLEGLQRFNKFTIRVTALLVVLVATAVLVMASLAYSKLYEVTETNAAIRIDRAARAAATIFCASLDDFTISWKDDGRPAAIRIANSSPQTALTFKPEYDTLLKEIGSANQGAANLFKLNPDTQAFERFATTFRRPDGSMPPPMSISQNHAPLAQDHAVFASLISNSTYVGEVSVMGRLRLAYMIPIQAADGTVAGALTVDVGWVDDLVVARTELRNLTIGSVLAILVLVAGLGVWRMTYELRPLKRLSLFADELAAGRTSETAPYLDRTDEVGALAHGMERVGEIQRELSYLAYTDSLTGLGNRSRYLADLNAIADRCKRGTEEWALLHVNLDRFRDANVALGQAGGDELLKRVGEAIVSKAGPEALVSRLASDQFAILMPCRLLAREKLEFCNDLLQHLSTPLSLGESISYMTASIGITMLPLDTKDPDDAHLNADLAVRKAKADGGNRYVFFALDMYLAVHQKLELEQLLRDAVEQGEIGVHYQPQIDPMTNKLVGLEALARWDHAEKGMITPAEFIPVAESTGLIVDLGDLVLEKTCRQARNWIDQGFEFPHIAVNVSPLQLWQPNFVGSVRSALERHKLAGHYLCLEVTKSLFIDQEEGRVRAILNALKAIGVSISLDDFGSGYSSLGYLNQLPFDQLKIDRSFVTDVDTDTHKQKMLSGIVSLGQALGLSVVAEGAETRQEIAHITSLGCDAVQGYFYAKPMQASEVPTAVNEISATSGLQKRLRA